MHRYAGYPADLRAGFVWHEADTIACELNRSESHPGAPYLDAGKSAAKWPLSNVWLGVSVSNQEDADAHIPNLPATPAALHFVNYEPALGPVDFTNVAGANALRGTRPNNRGQVYIFPHLDWVICGGESGPNARPMHPDWARSARDQCKATGVPFFFKQWGEWVSVSEVAGKGPHHSFPDGATVRRVGKKTAGHLLDGREHREWPR